MTKSKTTTETSPVNKCKCYISAETAGKIDGSGNGSGESFWIDKLSPTRAKVLNLCFCGLCVGDIVEITEHGPSGWNNEVVSVIERQSELYAYNYNFPGMKDSDKLPPTIVAFLHGIEKKGIRFEGVVMGIAMISRPNTMSFEDFEKHLNSGPLTFTPIEG
jgi:hypothetical protein